MAAMLTNLVFSSSNGNTIVYARDPHTAVKPALCLLTRSEGNGPTGNLTSTVQLVQGTNDIDGNLVASRCVLELKAKYPKNGTFTDMSGLIAIASDILNSDEFLAAVQKQLPLV